MTTVASPPPSHAPQRFERQAPAELEPRYELNVRLLVISLVAAVLLSVAGYFWHSFMVGHAAVVFLERAEQIEQEAEEADDPQIYHRASRYYFRYLQIRPDDHEVRARLAKTFDKAAQDWSMKARAIELYYRAVGIAPDQIDLRERLAELLLEFARADFKRLPAAIEVANELLRRDETNRVGMRVLAIAEWHRTSQNQAGSLRKSEVMTLFERGLKHHPGDIALAAAFAQIYRGDELQVPSQAERNELADAQMRAMLEASPDDPDAHLSHYLYSKRYDLPDAQEHIDRAVELGWDDVNVLLTAGQHELTEALQYNQNEEWQAATTAFKNAEKYYRRVIELEQSNERGHLGLGQTFRVQGKSGLAIQTWEEGLEFVGKENVELNARIVHTLIQLNRLDRVDEILSELQTAIDRQSSRWPAAVRNTAKNTVNFLRAKTHVKRGEYRQAAWLLEDALLVFKSGIYRVSADRLRNDVYECAILLGEAQSALGRWDLAANAFVEAIQTVQDVDEQKAREANIKAGEAYRRAGRDNLAAKYLAQVVESGSAPLGVWLVRVETLIRRQLSRPVADRNWDDVQAQLSNPPSRLRNSWQVKLLEADYVLARSGEEGTEAALRFLGRAAEMHPNDPELFQRLGPIYERLNRSELADQAVQKLLEIEGDESTRSTLVQAEILALRGQHTESEKLLLDALETSPEKQHTMLRYGLSQLYLQMGDLASAEQQLEALHAEKPEDSELVYRLAELAVDQGKFSELDPLIEKLRELEGPKTVRWKYFRALQHLSRSETARDDQFAEASKLSIDITGARPTWPPGYVLQAQLRLRQGNTDDAIHAYETALEFGETRIGVHEQYITLLYRTKRFEQARKALEKLQELTQTLFYLDLELKQQQGDTKAALRLAKEGVRVQPNDPYLRIRLGQALLLAGEKEQAREAYLKAVELDPKDLAVRGALVAFHLRTGNKEAALAAIGDVRGDPAFEAAQKELFQLQAYDALGDTEQADQHFEAALNKTGDDVDILLQLARYQTRKDAAAAESILRRALKIDPEHVQVRVRLAELLAQSGEESKMEEIERLLDEGEAGEKASPEMKRMRGRLLASRGDEQNRRKAIQIFESLLSSPYVTAGDRLQLARLLEADGRVTEAKKHYAALVSAPSPNPAHLVSYIDMLLRHNQLGASEPWVRKLSEVDGESLNTLAVQVRWMKASKRSDQEIEDRIEAFAQFKLLKAAGKAEKERLYYTIGRIYDNAGNNSGALRWYAELYKLNNKAYGPLAVALARAKRIGQAFDLWQRSAGSSGELADARILANIFSAANRGDEEFKQARPVLERAVAEHPDNIVLLFNVALAYSTQDHPREAVALYRQILEQEPRHVEALNNLAYALIDVPGRTEDALRYIGEAINISGEQPALLDTKAMIILEDSPEDAVQLLETATAMPSADPRYYFHLAIAYQKAGVMSKAREAMRRAREGNLADQALTASERNWLNTLNAELRN